MIHDLRHIRAFLAAARIGNFTRAAAELHISQSAFTVQIRQLEDALGVTLFDRSKRRIALTAAGRDVLVPLERILLDAEAVVMQTRQLIGLRRGVVRIAALPSLAAELLPLTIHEFRQLYPGIMVEIRDVVAESVVDSVRREDVDFGIGTRMRMDREITGSPLLEDRLCAFAPLGHLLTRRDSVNLRDLVRHPLILTARDSSVRDILDRALRSEKLLLSPAFEVNYMSTAIGMVRAGLGIAVLPEAAVGAEKIHEVRRLLISRPSLSRRIEIIRRKDRSLSSAAGKMIEILKQRIR
ncbi:MAG TPA: LysR family transcriptional regulator [Terracidiphilus sp.]|nr:LysR family transcriptional regulator [Terracidiphilus sp.]